MADSEEKTTLPAILKVVNMAEQGEAQNGETPKKKQRYQKRGSPYHTYTPEQKAMIGKYAALHGNTKAAEHFTKELGIRIAESTVRLHKKAYHALLGEGKNPEDVTAIPSGRKGRPRRVGGGAMKLGAGSSVDNDINAESGGSSSAMDESEPVVKPLVLIVACTDGQLELRELSGVANVVSYAELTDTEDLSNDVCSQVVGMIVGVNCLINRPLLDRCPKLRIVVRFGIGYDNVDIEYAGGLGIIVCNVPDYGIEEVADTALAHILTLYRQTIFLHQAMSQGEPVGQYKEVASLAKHSRRIRGKTLGLIGLGKTGAAVAVRAKAFGFHVIFYDPFIADGWDKAIGGIERVQSLLELVKKSDCVSLHCLLTVDTAHMINESLLSVFKKGAFLVNVARGGLVDESALANALKQGWIGGAALDVHETEPFSLKDSPLNDAPNLICTPHIAWYSKESYDELKMGAVKAIQKAVSSSDPLSLPNIVNQRYLNTDTTQARWN